MSSRRHHHALCLSALLAPAAAAAQGFAREDPDTHAYACASLEQAAADGQIAPCGTSDTCPPDLLCVPLVVLGAPGRWCVPRVAPVIASTRGLPSSLCCRDVDECPPTVDGRCARCEEPSSRPASFTLQLCLYETATQAFPECARPDASVDVPPGRDVTTEPSDLGDAPRPAVAGGCTCRVGRPGRPAASWAGVALLALAGWRRRYMRGR